MTNMQMTNMQKRKNKTLTHKDIRDLLTGFAASIELDQIRVDALSPDRWYYWFHVVTVPLVFLAFIYSGVHLLSLIQSSVYLPSR
jgi:hypothetical protein